MFEQARVILQYECLLVAVGFCDASDSELFPRYMIIAEEVQALKNRLQLTVRPGSMHPHHSLFPQFHARLLTSALLLLPGHEQVSREGCERT